MQYCVKPGDTLSAIALAVYGDSRRYLEIAQANQLADPNRLQVGQVLIIPTDTATTEEELSSKEPAPTQQDTSLEDLALSVTQLQQVFPQATMDRLQRYIEPLRQTLVSYNINTPLRICHFLAQIGHERSQLRHIEENLNYSAERLREVFGKYIKTDQQANEYANQAEKIASLVYGNRMGNGAESSRDGWRYRGRGFIQLTGKYNYQRLSAALDKDLVTNPDQLTADPLLCMQSAGWYWHDHQLNQLADANDIEGITKRINGGLHGLKDRKALYQRAKQIFS